MSDTLKFARALRDGGQFTPEQSERLSDAIAGEMASRADLQAMETKHGRKIDGLRADLRGDGHSLAGRFEAAKADTIEWVAGVIGFQSVATIGAAIVLA